MKPIKMFGLATLVALTAMAFVSATSVMAETTALCNTDPGTGEHEVCPAGHLVSHVHETTLVGVKAKLLTVSLVECDVLFLGDVTTANNLGNPLSVKGNYIYTNCGSGCVVEELEGTFTTIRFLKLGHELADVTFFGEIYVNCLGINCEFNFEELVGHALGPLLSTETNGEIRVEEQVLKKLAGGFLCPKTTKLDILTTPLSATYITE